MAKATINPHEGRGTRDQGPYLDKVDQAEAEVTRAAAESRAVLSPAPFTAGQPLITPGQYAADPPTPHVSQG